MGNSGDCCSDDAPPSQLFFPCSFELAPTSEGTASRSRANGWKAGESSPHLVRRSAGKAWRSPCPPCTHVLLGEVALYALDAIQMAWLSSAL